MENRIAKLEETSAKHDRFITRSILIAIAIGFAGTFLGIRQSMLAEELKKANEQLNALKAEIDPFVASARLQLIEITAEQKSELSEHFAGLVNTSGSALLGQLKLTGPYQVAQRNREGNNPMPMVESARSFCALSKVDFEDAEDQGELARCEVENNGERWTLRAVLGRTNDADAACSAFCIAW